MADTHENRRKNLRNWFSGGPFPAKDKSYFSQLLSGSAPFGEKAARRIERDYSMPDLFLDAEPANQQTSATVQSATEVIHRWDWGGSMGVGLLLPEQPGVIESWEVSHDWLRLNVRGHPTAHNLAIVTGFGDSMRPLFNPGDPLVIDTSVTTVDHDSIFFFRVGREGFIKRLQRVPGQGIIAISENKSYRDWVIGPEMDFEVFGRVIKIWRGDEF